MPHKGFPTWHSSSLSFPYCIPPRILPNAAHLPCRQRRHSSTLPGWQGHHQQMLASKLCQPQECSSPPSSAVVRSLCNTSEFSLCICTAQDKKKKIIIICAIFFVLLVLISRSFLMRHCSWNLPRVCICCYVRTASNVKISCISTFKKKKWTMFPSHLVTFALPSVLPFQFLLNFLTKWK